MMPLYKRLDAANRVIRSNDRFLDPQAEFACYSGLRRVGRQHPPGGQRLPHARKLHPVGLLGFSCNMQDIKVALGRDGETERVRESIQSSRREIGWMNDGLQWSVGHSGAPQNSRRKSNMADTHRMTASL